MSLIEINRNPSRKDLAWFGVILFLALVWVGFLVARATHNPSLTWYVAAGAGVLAAVYYVVPPIRRPMYVGWMYAVYPIGYVVSHVLLGVLYFGLLTPAGLLLRLFGYDPMQRRFDRAAKTYWIEREPKGKPSDYFRQF